MTVTDDLAGFLSAAPAEGGAAVVGWRFEVAKGASLRVGIRDSEFGGPYEGPGVALRLGGSLELHWSDGRLTRASADRRALTDPASLLDEWRATAIVPRDGKLPPLADPAILPTVEVFDPRVAAAVTTDPSMILSLLAGMGTAAREAGARPTDAVMRAGVSRRTVTTSRGFRADWDDTAFGVDLWIDELGGATFERRALPSPERADQLTSDAVTLAGQLRRVDHLPPEPRGVLFTPTALDALIGRFLLPNLLGRAIRDGKSLFSRADLESKRQVLRPDLDLVIDTTVPLSPASAPCSSEGVPAGRVKLIDGGRLTSPIVDLEISADLGYLPTPKPRGRPRALLEGALPLLDWREALSELGTGVVVRDLPGLHTQPSRRGEYALVTPDAQVVIHGETGGRCAIRLAGSLIDHVSHPSSRLVRYSSAGDLGLLVMNGVQLLPA
jgi:predicted Zn-dependent protease